MRLYLWQLNVEISILYCSNIWRRYIWKKLCRENRPDSQFRTSAYIGTIKYVTYHMYNSTCFIFRLNSWIFRIFKLSELNLNLNSPDCKASNILFNDILLEPISWELNVRNHFLNFCVGVRVGGHDVTNFTGVKIAWADVKSTKISYSKLRYGSGHLDHRLFWNFDKKIIALYDR